MHVSDLDLSPVTNAGVHEVNVQDASCHQKKLDKGGVLIYGSFWVGDAEFAIPVSAIREVVNEPKTITRVPLAPTFLKGLFNLRGMAIPIIDLRRLFELPLGQDEEESQDERKIAIVEDNGKCVGVLFDCAGEVLSKPNSAHVNFRPADDDKKGGVIHGVLTLEHGQRIVQTIDPKNLMNMECVPQTEIADARSTHQRKLGKRLSCVSFQFGHTDCAIDLRYVKEVRKMPPLDTTSFAYGYVIGSVKLRGVVVPVIDFRSYMGLENISELSDATLNSRNLLVMKSDFGLVGLMVYSIDSIMPFFESDIVSFPKLALPRNNVVKGSLINGERDVVLLLDHEELMSDPDLINPAKTCSEIYAGTSSEFSTSKSTITAARKTFIVFSLEGGFAMDSDVIIEVIDKPVQLMRPSFAMNYVEGIINLRGELITLINLREVYGLGPAPGDQQKVLIFRHGAQKYAILVDSVDEIAMTSADKVVNAKEVNFPVPFRQASEDVVSVLMCEGNGGSTRYILIMDGEAVVRRCA